MAHFYGHSRPAEEGREGSLEEKERGEMPSDIRKARKVFFLLETKYRRLKIVPWNNALILSSN